MSQLHFLGPTSLNRFPTVAELQELQRRPVPALHVFLDAARAATRRLWVLDLHFNPVGLRGLQATLQVSRARDVRIASEEAAEKHRGLSDLRKIVDRAWGVGLPENRVRTAPTRIRWYDRLRKAAPPYPHDRFAILDDALWHFGYATCGGGNNLAAASGPWSAVDSGAPTFFEKLCDWNEF